MCDSKNFFTELAIHISKRVSATQKKLNKFKNLRKNLLIKEINELGNNDRISMCERELNTILNQELRRLISNKKIFENLNYEKPTKKFLDVAHNVGKGDKLSLLKDEDGNDFASTELLKEHVTNFYSNLYSLDPEVEGSIEDFLGEDICNNPIVANSKLTDEQREHLDRDLTFEELEKALGEANLKSAPGIDGYSTKFIKKFFYILGRPLFNCCKLCLDEESLIDLFSTAQIKLIPKKGDLSKIKNWRPISLLSNFYKILSRAINNRLKSVVNRVLSRSQKGFTRTRQIHEVILNLSETINHCTINNVKGAMVCVDQAKAFDSVDHTFMVKTFRFFGFGDKFISWLRTIGTNRKACIIFNNGEKGNLFNLLRGTAQGDCPSPIIYNICAQVLIFKIELTETIRRIDCPAPAQLPILIDGFNNHPGRTDPPNNDFEERTKVSRMTQLPARDWNMKTFQLSNKFSMILLFYQA
jgi:hypothetical protein